MTTQKPNITHREAEIVQPIFAALADVKRTDRAYFEQLEDTDPQTAPRGALVALLASAPNDLVKGFILGQLTIRISIQSLTGREF